MSRRARLPRLGALGYAFAFVVACSGGDADSVLSREELLKPETCKECHRKHYREWESSMHAYAARDPVFIAMNKRGQREAKLGKFCVKCHAPMAVIEQPDTDWTKADVEKLPEHLKGVTCYFCHNAIAVTDDHNNMLHLANDTTMRGGIGDPADPKVHHAAYSKLHDRYEPDSSALCGGCHDIVTPEHVRIERTFEEYKESVLAKPDARGTISTCQTCHMLGSAEKGVAANVKGVIARTLHEHTWPAVDVALDSFPNRAAQRAAVECQLGNSISFDFQADLQTATTDGTRFVVTIETHAGHKQPSGAAQDRRMWLELVAYDDQDAVIYESGRVADDAPEPVASESEQLWTFHDTIYDADENETHMFWQAAPSESHPEGFESRALPVAKTLIAGDHSAVFGYFLPTIPARIEFRVRMRPIGRDVLQDLVDSHDLDAAILDEMPTFTLYSALAKWPKGAIHAEDFELTRTDHPDCQHYICVFDPKAFGCTAD